MNYKNGQWYQRMMENPQRGGLSNNPNPFNYRFNWSQPAGAMLNIFGSLGNIAGMLPGGQGQEFGQKWNSFFDRQDLQGLQNPNYNAAAPSGLLGLLNSRSPGNQPQIAQTGKQAPQSGNGYGVNLMARDYTNPFAQRQAAWEKLRNAR